MSPQNAIARCAGLVYLLVVLTGIYSLLYVPAQLSAPGDAVEPIRHLAERAPLARSGLVVLLIDQLCFLILPVLLYRLLSSTDRVAARLMVGLAWISVPLVLAAIAQRLGAVNLMSDPVLANAIEMSQRQALAIAAQRQYGNNLLMASIFWGLWLLPLGWLIWRSRRLPRVLGALLFVGGLGLVIDVIGKLMLPNWSEMAIAGYVTLPAAVGEIGACLYLLMFRSRPSNTMPLSSVDDSPAEPAS